jgi:hypothetical protein
MGKGLIIYEDRIGWADAYTETNSVPLTQYAEALGRLAERGECEEPIPPGVRFLIHREPATLVVLEEPPQVRVLRWISDISDGPFGDNADYRTVRLAFPYIVILAVFMAGTLTTKAQCFYRTAPLSGKGDRLFFPNIYNVDQRDDMLCWLCLRKLDGIVRTDSWNAKVQAIRNHFWGATFNRSATLDRHKSYWWRMKGIDSRISSLEAWEQASAENPLFPLAVPWTQLDVTLGQVMDTMLNKLVAPRRFAMTQYWTDLLQRLQIAPRS